MLFHIFLPSFFPGHHWCMHSSAGAQISMTSFFKKKKLVFRYLGKFLRTYILEALIYLKKKLCSRQLSDFCFCCQCQFLLQFHRGKKAQRKLVSGFLGHFSKTFFFFFVVASFDLFQRLCSRHLAECLSSINFCFSLFCLTLFLFSLCLLK
jgi:hypothetical protein